MNPVERARDLKRAGLFAEALKILLGGDAPAKDRIAADVLRAELLETTGEYESARTLAATLLSSQRLTQGQRSTCEYVLGRIDVDLGEVNDGIGHFQRAALCAQDANDIAAEFDARIQLFHVLFERVVVATTSGSLLAEIRALATKLGDSRSTAKLHLFVGVMEARRGLLSNARRHLRIARKLLKETPHAYLNAFAENMAFGIAIVQSELEAARVHGALAIEQAEKAGLALILRAAMGNLGNLYHALGDFERASKYFEKALIRRSQRLLGPYENPALEGLARVRLAQGRLDECKDALDRIEASVDDHTSYFYRDAELTRAYLLAREDRLEGAISRTDSAIALSQRAGDLLLTKTASLAKAELCERAGRVDESMAILEATVPSLIGDSPELFAHAEQTLACALVREGDLAAGRCHRDRASRICATLGSVTAGRTLDERWARATAAATASSPSLEHDTSLDVQRATRRALHAMASAIAHSNRSAIVADELLRLIASAGSTNATHIVSRRRTDTEPATSTDAASFESSHERYVEIGQDNDTVVGLRIEPKRDVDSVATINAVRILVNAVQELVRARTEREERATLWPVDELPVEGDASVISGHMRELMTYARRIATTKVNVLITGESGTGKEILARAIHTFSNRSQKPFVPFNCTAIPRDLLESQLFGHRRGAFTGADRDQVGLIRAAREGTLFLDEIGELGLDLQPKLLRFLESGEIAPLGEAGPQTIDVRIIAATNTHLEDAVRAGRFREDLFYRLNVVRLSLRPLRERRDEIPGFVTHFVARAADEFKKGRITVTEETIERLLLYRWPGNVRQLQNEIRRIVALAEPNSTITPDAIDDEILGALPIFRRPGANGSELSVSLHAKLPPTLARIECEMIQAALHKHHGRVNVVAKALGISRKGLYLKRQRFGL